MPQLKIHLFKNGASDFLAMLEAQGISYEGIRPQPGRVVNAGESIWIIDIVPILGPLAWVMVAWVKARSSRSVKIQTADRRVIDIKGYSEKDVEKILDKAVSISVIQTEPDRPRLDE